MDDFKISLFEVEYKQSFPGYKTLEKDDCNDLVIQIANKYNVSILNIEEELVLKQSFYEGRNATENFSLISTLNNIGILSSSKVLINWHKFDKIDEFDLKDLDKYFYDIWFPGSDDIDIFDRTLNWVLSIRHDGCVTFVMQPK